MSDISSLIAGTYTWLSQAEAANVAAFLTKATDGQLTGKAQMTAYARELDSMGLPITPQLLISLSGRGSKTAAMEVTRALTRERFEERMALKGQAGGPANAQEVAPATSPTSTAAIIDAFRAVMADMRLSPAPEVRQSTTEQEILSTVKHISGELKWLKSTVDTERQLRRHLERSGPLDEPTATLKTETSEQKRAVIGNLSASLQSDYRKMAGRVLPPTE